MLVSCVGSHGARIVLQANVYEPGQHGEFSSNDVDELMIEEQGVASAGLPRSSAFLTLDSNSSGVCAF